MGFYSSHLWGNGAILTVEALENGEISIRVQAQGEKMLADFIMGEHEATCLAASIMTVLAKGDEEKFNVAVFRPKK